MRFLIFSIVCTEFILIITETMLLMAFIWCQPLNDVKRRAHPNYALKEMPVISRIN